MALEIKFRNSKPYKSKYMPYINQGMVFTYKIRIKCKEIPVQKIEVPPIGVLPTRVHKILISFRKGQSMMNKDKISHLMRESILKPNY